VIVSLLLEKSTWRQLGLQLRNSCEQVKYNETVVNFNEAEEWARGLDWCFWLLERVTELQGEVICSQKVPVVLPEAIFGPPHPPPLSNIPGSAPDF